jgi:nicotinamidase-related amidase
MLAMLHNWHIEAAQYERHERRRGRRHGYEWLDPTRTALIVIDMVPFFLNDPDIGHYPRGIVPNIITLAQTVSTAGGTVAWVLPAAHEPSAASVEFLGPEVAELYRISGGTGSLRSRLWHEFVVADADLLVEKSAASAFFPGRCELPALLEMRDIESVLITGTVANVCCESSARDASFLGYRTIMVADANAALRDQDLNATLHTFYRTFGDVRPTSEIVELLAAGRPKSRAQA